MVVEERSKKEAVKGGFALVISLALMSFILLLMLSLTIFLKIEITTASNQLEVLKARQNALLGAMIALGELQEHAGRDTIATAQSNFNVASGQAFWTGVWDASNGHRMWLVSGNEAVNPDDPDTSDPLARPEAIINRADGVAETGHVWVIHEGTVGESDSRLFVQVPKVEFSSASGVENRYAWWVGDEGVKANLTLEHDSDRVIDKPANLLLLSPPGLNIAAMEGMETISSDPAIRARLMHQSETIFAGVSSGKLQQNYHNLTTQSAGILTNAARGGLKWDLTAAFQNDTEFQRLLASYGRGMGGRRIFPAVNAQGNPIAPNLENPGGPSWEQLRNYHNTVVNPSNQVDLQTQTAERSGVFPVIGGFQLYWGASRTSAGTPRFWVMPAVTFWNPYNVSIRVPASYVRLTSNRAFSGGTQRDCFNFVVWGYTSHDAEQDSGYFFPAQGATGFYPFRFPVESFTIGPGESLTFSPASSSALSPTSGLTPTLRAGWRDNVGFYLDRSFIMTDATVDESELTHYFIGIRESGLPSSGYASRVEQINLEWNLTDPGNSKPTGAMNPEDSIQFVANVFARHVDDNRRRTAGDLLAEPNPPFLTDVQPIDIEKRGIDVRLSFTNDSATTFPYWQPRHRNYALTPWLAHLNPRAHFHNISPVELSNTSHYSPPSYAHGWRVDGARSELGFGDEAHIGSGYYDSGFFGKERTILFDLPRADKPVLSIGQLAHTNLGFSAIDEQTNPLSGNRGITLKPAQVMFNETALFLLQNIHPAYPIGNSLADPRINSTEVARNWTGSPFVFSESPFPTANSSNTRGWHYDRSLLMNTALWDDFFLSGLSASGPIQSPHPHFVFTISSLADEGRSRQAQSAAALIRVRGMFNVNSTSIEAWKAILSAFNDLSVERLDGSMDGGSGFSAYLRTLLPRDSGWDSKDLEDADNAYAGFRRLSSREIDSLARSIVKVMRERRLNKGPYTGLADFINRDPRAENEQHRRQGLLHQAIDPIPGTGAPSASPLENEIFNLNHRFRIPSDYYRSRAGDFGARGMAGHPTSIPHEEHMDGPMAFGVPGFLMPADVLARLGPVLSTRSDTFTIRAFGEVVSPLTGRSTNAAWCEMVVQRLPVFVDPSDAADADMDTLSSVNERFGRRFEIVSFRWLNKDEI